MTVTVPAPVRTPSNNHGGAVQTSLLSRVVPMGIMTIAAVYVLLPLWWLLVGASKDQGQLADGNPLWFSDLRLLSNLDQLFAYRDGIFLRWMLNSLAYTGGAALLGTLLAGMCGYALAKYRFPGREVLFNVILGGVLVPATALALPLFLMFSTVHAANTFWSVFLPSLVNPFGVYLARIYAATSVPDDLMEAARIDGAGEVRTFFTVSARLMAPAFLTIFLFHFVAIWNNFLLPLIMLGNEKLFPVTLGLYTWNSQATQNPELRGLVLIGALVSIVPMIAVFLLLQRFWRGGLNAGSLK
ncbi:multiple sugar transport system permease protein [Krasilnikovia cinnamomea]|uniref:Multiple sugar transport system permease protein n=1 Tax=Krasilnikovia cinnamomea TaxID=349313 RepID=A0A4Q7ZR12_9ACTN|nr:carbohydrate ABC transporter permease [Krasilnikovia cinnamomea]RZU53578.1 multiple sugar transport system permease protein [Krasilnikovia cinnamomea]